MAPTKYFRIVSVTVCSFVVALCVLAQAQNAATSSKTPNPGLVNQLTEQLNIAPEQAVGGTGAIFSQAKSRLNPAQFSQLAAAVPGMDSSFLLSPR